MFLRWFSSTKHLNESSSNLGHSELLGFKINGKFTTEFPSLPFHPQATSIARFNTNSHKIKFPPKSYYTCCPQHKILKNWLILSRNPNGHGNSCTTAELDSQHLLQLLTVLVRKNHHTQAAARRASKAGSWNTENEATSAPDVWQADCQVRKGRFLHPRRRAFVNYSILESMR